MQKSIWKIAALAGVVALGFFAVLQTQRGLQDEHLSANPDGKNADNNKPTDTPRQAPPSSEPLTTVSLSQYEPPAMPPGEASNGSSTRGNSLQKTEPTSKSGGGVFPAGNQDDDQVDDGFRPKSPDSGRPVFPSGDDSKAKGTSGGSGAGIETADDSSTNPFATASANAAAPKSQSGESQADASPDEPKPLFTGNALKPGTADEGNGETTSGAGNDAPRSLFGDPVESEKSSSKTSQKQGNVASPAKTPFDQSFPTENTPQGPTGSASTADQSLPNAKTLETKTSGSGSQRNGASGSGTVSGPNFSGGSGDSDDAMKSAGSPGENPFGGSESPGVQNGKRETTPLFPQESTGGNPFHSSPQKRDSPSAAPAAKSDDRSPGKAGPQDVPSKKDAPFDNAPNNDATDTTSKSTTSNPTVEPPQSLFDTPPRESDKAPSKKTEERNPFVEGGEELSSSKTGKADDKDPPSRLMPDSTALPLQTSDGSGDAKTEPPKTTPTRTVLPKPQQQPQLTIEKTAPKNAVLGKPFVYDIVIKNHGRSNAHQVVVKDPVPRGVRLEGTDPQAYLTGKTLMWKLGKIGPGKTRRISVKVTPMKAGQIGSIATVNFVSEVAAKTVITAPKLTLDMQGPSTAKLGQEVTFRFKVKNTGSADAKDVWLRNIVPDGLKHPAGDDLEYKIGTLAAGKTEHVALSMTVGKAGKHTNRAFVTASGGVRLEAKSVVEVTEAKLAISRTGPKRKLIGRTAIYQTMITNASAEAVDAATLTETVPAGMEFVAASHGGKYDPAKRVVRWNLGGLPGRKSKTVQLKLLPKQTGVQKSEVHATTSGGGSVRTASATKIVGYASLGVEVPAIDQPVNVGEQVTLRIIGHNRGTAASSDVRLKVTLPKQLKLVRVRGQGKYKSEGQAITFQPVASLPGKKQIVYDLVLRAAAAGDSRVKVQIESEEMSKPLSREEAVLVLPDAQSP